MYIDRTFWKSPYDTPFRGRGASCLSFLFTGRGSPDNGIYESDGEFGFKFLDVGCIAALYIPKGATVHIDGDRTLSSDYRILMNRTLQCAKCRTELALCLEIGALYSEQGQVGIRRCDCAQSQYTLHFLYHPMRLVYPETVFDMHDSVCSTGIHYYCKPAKDLLRIGLPSNAHAPVCDWFRQVTKRWSIDELEEICAKEWQLVPKLDYEEYVHCGYIEHHMKKEETNEQQ